MQKSTKERMAAKDRISFHSKSVLAEDNEGLHFAEEPELQRASMNVMSATMSDVSPCGRSD